MKSYKKNADDVIQSSIEKSILDKTDEASRDKSSSSFNNDLKKMLKQTENKQASTKKVNGKYRLRFLI